MMKGKIKQPQFFFLCDTYLLSLGAVIAPSSSLVLYFECCYGRKLIVVGLFIHNILYHMI